MTSRRGLLTVLLTLVLLAPLAVLPGRASGPLGVSGTVSGAKQAVLGNRGSALGLVVQAERDRDRFAAGGSAPGYPVAGPTSPARLAWAQTRTARPAALCLPPCGLRAGPRQPTGPPFTS